MKTVAKFEKVSYVQFRKDWLDTFYNVDKTSIGIEEIENQIRSIYDNIKLPKRSTIGSAGYDFFAPKHFELYHNDVIKIPTGVRCFIATGWVLMMFPRSGQGFKYGIHMANTIPVIDSDYYNANNEGHIFVKLINDSILTEQDFKKSDNHFSVTTGQAFCQGVFLPYGVTVDDNTEGVRIGGLGSTDKPQGVLI